MSKELQSRNNDPLQPTETDILSDSINNIINPVAFILTNAAQGASPEARELLSNTQNQFRDLQQTALSLKYKNLQSLLGNIGEAKQLF